MNVNVVSNVDNKLLDRKEVCAELSFDKATPKRSEIKQELCGKIGANPELTVLQSVSSTFGTKVIKVTAHAYATKEALMQTEPKHIKIREGLMEKEKKEAKAAPKKEAKK